MEGRPSGEVLESWRRVGEGAEEGKERRPQRERRKLAQRETRRRRRRFFRFLQRTRVFTNRVRRV